MNGNTLTLSLVGALAVGAALGRRGSRAASPFTTGYCLAFAKVLKKRLGRGAVLYDVVESNDPDFKIMFMFPGTPHHAVVAWKGLFLDADGAFTEDELLARWNERAPSEIRRPLHLELHNAARAKDVRLASSCPAYLLWDAENIAKRVEEEARHRLGRRGSRSTRWVYHLTYRSDLPSIARQGLTPRSDTQDAWGNEPGVYFVNAFGYEAGAPESEEPAWLRLPAPHALPASFWTSLQEGHTLISFPPDAIEVWVDAEGRPAAKADGVAWKPLREVVHVKRGSRATDLASTPAFRRWFGDSQVVNEAGRPLMVYHGTDFTGSTSFTGKGGGKGLSKFASRSKAHLGFHFGTAAAANEKIAEDRTHWMDRKRSKPVALFDDAHRDRVRMQVTQRERELEGRAKRIRAAISDRQPPAELEELAEAYESKLPDAIAAYWRMRDTKTVPPTPQETRELQEIRTQQDALAEALSATFAWARPGENILPVYLSIQRPARMNDANWGDVRQIRLKNPRWDLEAKNLKELRAELEDLGYDGIVYENRVEDVGSTSWIAFRPEQIKSATGNRGTFSPDDPRVNFNRSPR